MIHSLDLELIVVDETFFHDNGKNLLGLHMVANNQNYVKTEQLEALGEGLPCSPALRMTIAIAESCNLEHNEDIDGCLH